MPPVPIIGPRRGEFFLTTTPSSPVAVKKAIKSVVFGVKSGFFGTYVFVEFQSVAGTQGGKKRSNVKP